MRIITRKLWRAFPELDGYDDAQCAKFVNAAAGSYVRCFGRFLGALAVALLIPTIVMVIAALIVFVFDLDSPMYKDVLMNKVILTAGAIGVSIVAMLAPMWGYIARDMLLRRRVRWVLHVRGRCVHCNYSLIGLPIPTSLKLTCPECGEQSTVDESMGKLTKPVSV